MTALDEVKTEAILAAAQAIYGMPLPEGSGALCQQVTAWALALCGRQDVPEEMELALGYLLVRALDGGVSSVSRGDTALVYDDKAAALLSPFRRLQTVKGGGAG